MLAPRVKTGRLLTLLLALALAACAIGNKQDYRTIGAQLPYSGRGAVTVLGIDERPYVLAGKKKPDYVGLQRSHVGIPFDVRTGSGRPFATELTDAFGRALATSGFTPRSIAVVPGTTLDSARSALLRDRPRRALLVRIVQWESFSMINTSLDYDLEAIVYDGTGKPLASQHLAGSDKFEGHILGAAKISRDVVPTALPQKIEALLDAPAIRAALQS